MSVGASIGLLWCQCWCWCWCWRRVNASLPLPVPMYQKKAVNAMQVIALRKVYYGAYCFRILLPLHFFLGVQTQCKALHLCTGDIYSLDGCSHGVTWRLDVTLLTLLTVVQPWRHDCDDSRCGWRHQARDASVVGADVTTSHHSRSVLHAYEDKNITVFVSQRFMHQMVRSSVFFQLLFYPVFLNIAVRVHVTAWIVTHVTLCWQLLGQLFTFSSGVGMPGGFKTPPSRPCYSDTQCSSSSAAAVRGPAAAAQQAGDVRGPVGAGDSAAMSHVLSGEICYWLYEGCSQGQCMCDPKTHVLSAKTGKCAHGVY